jgi:hypothetical protein
MAKFDHQYARDQVIDRLADRDPIFRVNFAALVKNHRFRQLRPTVTQWLVRQALARERRQEQQQARSFAPSQAVNSVERELFG